MPLRTGPGRDGINYSDIRSESFGDNPLGRRAAAERQPGSFVGRASAAASSTANKVASGTRALATRAMYAATPSGAFADGKFRDSLQRTSQGIGQLLGVLVASRGQPHRGPLANQLLEALPQLMAPMVARDADQLSVFEARAAHHIEHLSARELLALRAELQREESTSGSAAGFLEILTRCATQELDSRLRSKYAVTSEISKDFRDKYPGVDTNPVQIQWLDEEIRSGAFDENQAVDFLKQQWTSDFLVTLAADPALRATDSRIPDLALQSIALKREEFAADFVSMADDRLLGPAQADVQQLVHGMDFAPFGLSTNYLFDAVTHLADKLGEYRNTFIPNVSARPDAHDLSAKIHEVRETLISILSTEGSPKLGERDERKFNAALDALDITEPERQSCAHQRKWATGAQALYDARASIDAREARSLVDKFLDRDQLRGALHTVEYEYRFKIAQGLITERDLGDAVKGQFVDAFEGSVLGKSLLQQHVPEWLDQYGKLNRQEPAVQPAFDPDAVD